MIGGAPAQLAPPQPPRGAYYQEALERQCIELREEQRQILSWLAKSEEAAAAEKAGRERAEASLRGLLEQTVKAQEMVGEQLGGSRLNRYVLQ